MERKVCICECCKFETECVEIKAPHGPLREEGVTYWFCDLCSNSLASHVVTYPGQYGNQYIAVSATMYAANAILKALEKAGD